MKLYGHPASTCTRKVLATLAEKGQGAEFVHVEFATGEHKQPAHLARQPFGKVPALEHDGFALYESRAIIKYIDQVLPGPALTPTDAKARARMEQWLSVEHSYFSPAAMKIVWQVVFTKWQGGTPDQGRIAEGKAELQTPLQVLDRALANSKFLAGDQLTLADISYLPYLEYLDVGGEGAIVGAFDNVQRWWSTCRARPGWQTAIGNKAQA